MLFVLSNMNHKDHRRRTKKSHWQMIKPDTCRAAKRPSNRCFTNLAIPKNLLAFFIFYSAWMDDHLLCYACLMCGSSRDYNLHDCHDATYYFSRSVIYVTVMRHQTTSRRAVLHETNSQGSMVKIMFICR